MSNNGGLWGAIEETTPQIPDVSEDIQRSMDNCCLDSLPMESDEKLDEKPAPVELDSMDPIMLYSITLHKFAAKVTDAIQHFEANKQLKVNQQEDLQLQEHLLKIPPPPQINYTHVPNVLNCYERTKTSFTKGEEVTHVELSHAVAKKALMQCVATMFAHVGFETTYNGVLMLMTDVLEEFLRKICKKMKTSCESEGGDKRNFPYFADKVLTDCGMGGYQGIHDYYQNRILKYVHNLHHRCQKLVNQYQQLFIKIEIPMQEEPHAYTAVTVKNEEEEVIEMQLDPNFEGTERYKSLEPGFQLLHSLENSNLAEVSEDGTTTFQNVTGTIINEAMGKINVSAIKKKRIN